MHLLYPLIVREPEELTPLEDRVGVRGVEQARH